MKKAALLAPAACALAFAAAGCGGNGTAAGTTTTGQGGVLGAGGNLNQARAHVEIGRVNAILNGSLAQLMHTHSATRAEQLATRATAQLRGEAARIQQMNVPPRARQQQQSLVSALQALAGDISTVKASAQTGKPGAVAQSLHALSSVYAVRSALTSFRAALASSSASGSATVSTPLTTGSMTTTSG